MKTLFRPMSRIAGCWFGLARLGVFLRCLVVPMMVFPAGAVEVSVASSSSSCEDCAEFGLCHPRNGICRAESDRDCAPTRVCLQNGHCSAYDGRCVKSRRAAQADKGRPECEAAGGRWQAGVRDFGRQGACEAAELRHEQSPRLFDLRVACLDRRRRSRP